MQYVWIEPQIVDKCRIPNSNLFIFYFLLDKMRLSVYSVFMLMKRIYVYFKTKISF